MLHDIGRKAATILSAFALVSSVSADEKTIALAKTIPSESYAQNMRAEYASHIHLAWFKTSDQNTNTQIEKGMRGLSSNLTARSAKSLEKCPVVMLDPQKITDTDLSLFPFIYWPLINAAPGAQILKADDIPKIQDYLKNVGFILFDVLDDSISLHDENHMPQIIKDLGITSLTRMSEFKSQDTKLPSLAQLSFHIFKSPAGVIDDKNVWISPSSILPTFVIGRNRWAESWDETNYALDEAGREQAIRSGINFVMLPITGSYLEHYKELLINRWERHNEPLSAKP